ncbi:MAG: phthalate 4,5-dioxygenase oxygenase subunit [Gammaproteobacteria bacterium]|jgi:phthalate 4,5-dioxygenase oxygenase subunit
MNKLEQLDLITHTGPDTTMGLLIRRYWIPFLLAEELPGPDCAPVRVKLLSEELIAFCDTEGRLGLIDRYCAHRGASLWFGRNEESGLRCPYHGWKYDVEGNCIELPSEPAGSDLCKSMKLTSYPCVEKGGVIWAYMGPPDLKPELPDFEWMSLPPENRYIAKRSQECNYLQAMEGGIDSSHISFLHSGELHTDPLHKNTKGAHFQADRTPKFEVMESDGGLLIGARRNADEGEYYWRVSQWIMPWWTMIPPYGDNALNGHAWVPIDDENNFAWSLTYHPTRALTEDELQTIGKGGGMHVELVPGTFRPVMNKENDYLMDRNAQKSGRTYSGIMGIAMQDASLQESMGSLQNREKEHLVSTDAAIMMARRRLFQSAQALQKNGTSPPGLETVTHRVRSASFTLPVDKTFYEEKANAFVVTEGVDHTSI